MASKIKLTKYYKIKNIMTLQDGCSVQSPLRDSHTAQHNTSHYSVSPALQELGRESAWQLSSNMTTCHTPPHIFRAVCILIICEERIICETRSAKYLPTRRILKYLPILTIILLSGSLLSEGIADEIKLLCKYASLSKKSKKNPTRKIIFPGPVSKCHTSTIIIDRETFILPRKVQKLLQQSAYA